MRLFGRSATSLVNALNKSPSVMLILYKAIEEGARFRYGVWMEFDADASVGEVCGVAVYRYKVLDEDALFSPAADCSGVFLCPEFDRKRISKMPEFDRKRII